MHWKWTDDRDHPIYAYFLFLPGQYHARLTRQDDQGTASYLLLSGWTRVDFMRSRDPQVDIIISVVVGGRAGLGACFGSAGGGTG